VELLDRLDLFRPLERHERDALAEGMRRVTFARGETIIRQGDPADSAYLVGRGDVRVWLQQGDVTQEVATLGPGDLIGEMSLMTGDPRSATCTAVSDVSCYVVDHASLQRLLTVRPRIADELSALLAERQTVLQRKSGELVAKAATAQQGAEVRQTLVGRIRRFFDLA
jgi:CRP-like cAMP-binding protein